MRVRVRYEKSGKLRFISAIDLGRVFERALRKADLPIAYSEGFSPHPRVSFTDALPLGCASTGEYAELAFAVPVQLRAAVERLNTAFPTGVRVLGAVQVEQGQPKLASWLRASCWDVFYPEAALTAGALRAAVEALGTAQSLPVERVRKGAAVTVDLRPALHRIAARSGGGRFVRAVLHHVEPPVRPSELHLALGEFFPGMPAPHPLPAPTLAMRVAQGSPSPGGLTEALSGALVEVDEHLPTGQRQPL